MKIKDVIRGVEIKEKLLKILLEFEFGMSLNDIYDFVKNKSGLPKSDAWKFVVRSKEKLADCILKEFSLTPKEEEK